ncbi:unnamed protein product [Rotaria socialis]|uniref:RNA-dependent RNA polymerase n=1 Tax=Rotaria socialis TaxID=392032 RepID=A0A820CEM5_9BILA|nr:unnamed protein product [Rotaria socialis]CAF4222444.1 unnamed protein product [Rotaria socialis]
MILFWFTNFSVSMDGDQVPCQFKNLQLKPNAACRIYENIRAKLVSAKTNKNVPLEKSDIEQTSSYDRKLAYFIRFHLRDILTSDYRQVWFNIQTKALEDIEDRTQIIKQTSDDIVVVYSLGAMLSYDVFTGHINERTLANIYVQKFPKAIKLETATYHLTVHFKNIDSQILINHSTSDNSIQVIFMLKAPPTFVRKGETKKCDHVQFMNNLPLCSDLLVRFFPAHTAWNFLRNLPIAGYSRRASDDIFHINFSLFRWQKDSSSLNSMSMPTCASNSDSYGIEMLWSLGYLFQDKYNEDSQSIFGNRQKDSYNLCCKLWRNLKQNHCYGIKDAFNDTASITGQTTSNISSNLTEVIFAIITPNRIEYQPKQMTRCYRAFDLYPAENWLLVHIRDYNGIDKVNHLDLQTRVRFRNLMIKGIPRGKRYFKYFGSSGSQMNDQAGWFLSLPPNETIESARQRIGDLSKIFNVSTYISRVGLYLTTLKSQGINLTYIPESNDNNEMSYSTRASNIFSRLTARVRRLFYKTENVTIRYTATIIRDIENDGFCFTDGCGKISLGLAKQIAQSMGIGIHQKSDIPSAFQVRIAGCKGMLSIDPESKSNEFYIKVRKSMVKFDSDDWTLYVVDHSRPMPLSLNNQVIRLLSDLGNSNGVFESIQMDCIDRKEFWHPPAHCYLNALDSLDQSKINEMQIKYKNAKNFLIRNKIPLPLNEARNLFGIADETGILKPGECFIQYRSLKDSSTFDQYVVVTGTVLATKNPCLYPGDIRKLKAVDVPKLKSCIRDCIVFSSQGRRPSFNEMAGSDLDGDQYWVYWGDRFRVDVEIEPLLYPSTKKAFSDRITDDLIVDHVLNTFTDTAPGIIANTHSVIGDKHSAGTFSKECVECAKLFARAIDARKTGENINMTRIKELKEKYGQTYPGWMMKFDKPIMDPPSTSINEILHRKAQEAWIDPNTYNDILRYFPLVQNPADLVAIDLDESDGPLEQERTEDNSSGCCCLCVCIIIIIVIVVVFLHYKKKI